MLYSKNRRIFVRNFIQIWLEQHRIYSYLRTNASEYSNFAKCLQFCVEWFRKFDTWIIALGICPSESIYFVFFFVFFAFAVKWFKIAHFTSSTIVAFSFIDHSVAFFPSYFFFLLVNINIANGFKNDQNIPLCAMSLLFVLFNLNFNKYTKNIDSKERLRFNSKHLHRCSHSIHGAHQ